MKPTEPGDIVLVQQPGKAPYVAVKLRMDDPKIQNEIHVSPLTEIRVTSETSVTKIEPT